MPRLSQKYFVYGGTIKLWLYAPRHLSQSLLLWCMLRSAHSSTLARCSSKFSARITAEQRRSLLNLWDLVIFVNTSAMLQRSPPYSI
ncbi:hypothetical protein DFH06DRAFT_1245527 [Mycena polygramma]|nr:hypothetical protein DFH06DRAFT_1245527 [Mycena polygramma]